MTTTYTTHPATLSMTRRTGDALPTYDITATIHETGEVITLSRVLRPGVAMQRAGIVADGALTEGQTTEGTVWRVAR